MVCKLADKSKLSDTSWIKPGMASWEWWNGASPYGEDVNFTTGCNTETYKYFIDFASHYNIPYHCCPEKFYHSLSCVGPSPSGTLAVRSV
jgi:hypothetical protein